jgi:hypothetical protein
MVPLLVSLAVLKTIVLRSVKSPSLQRAVLIERRHKKPNLGEQEARAVAEVKQDWFDKLPYEEKLKFRRTHRPSVDSHQRRKPCARPHGCDLRELAPGLFPSR